MRVRISSDLLAAIRAEAAASPGVEICGLLLGRRDEGEEVVEEARDCRNVATDPARRFEIDPAALIAAYRQARGGGAAVLGCYHSHPMGLTEPSPCDAAEAEANGWVWVIVAGDTASAWRAVERGARHGRFDEVVLLSEGSGLGG